MILKPGDVFRRFRVLATAGEGGMGIVYRAHDTRLGRDVALKFVTHIAQYHSAFSDRLRREARSLAALNHPNIVTIHDIDEVDGIPFLVLEWVDGKPLSDLSVSRPLSTGEFCRFALPVAAALGAAHDRGIIHRDVKPSNVLVSNDGRIKVVDFGSQSYALFSLGPRSGGEGGRCDQSVHRRNRGAMIIVTTKVEDVQLTQAAFGCSPCMRSKTLRHVAHFLIPVVSWPVKVLK